MKRRLLHTILLAAALSSAPATAFADTPVKAYKSSAYCYAPGAWTPEKQKAYEEATALSERQIEVEIKPGKANFRVLDCDGSKINIYNIVGRLVFSHKIEGDVWQCTVPLPKGVYIVSAGKYARKITITENA